jgi:mycothiol synthase
VAELMNAYDASFGSGEQVTEDDVRSAWEELGERGRATLVHDGDEIAATVECARRFEMGWVGMLGVRPGWRRRGLGELLLRTAFAQFARRGETRVGLGVDAQNETGATRLYERAGMSVAFQITVFRKDLR